MERQGATSLGLMASWHPDSAGRPRFKVPASCPNHARCNQANPSSKVSVVLELLRSADLESASRKHRVTAATLTEWRDRFLAGGGVVLKSRDVKVEDEEKRRLKAAIANVSVDNELLCEKIARLEDGRPLAFWKLKP